MYPFEFEFRAKSSNRMQLDALETGHYYLNASTGNIKLGDVDIDVSEMPCIINVGNNSSKRMIINGIIGHNITVPQSDMVDGGYFDSTNGAFTANQGMCYSPIYYEILPNTTYELFGGINMRIHLYDEGQSFIKAIDSPDSSWTSFTTSSNAKYLRFSCNIYYKKDYVLISNPITLSKLPSHRIPTTFTQGMKSSVDFGYWEGIKSAVTNTVYTTDMVDWNVVTKTMINGHEGLEFNRLEYGSSIVEDEFDISTGKYIKRVGVFDLTQDNFTMSYNSQRPSNYPNHQSFMVRGLPNRKPNGIAYVGQYRSTNVNNAINCDIVVSSSTSVKDGFYLYTNEYTIPTSDIQTVLQWWLDNGITKIYYELNTPEVTYYDMDCNEFKTAKDRTNLQVYHNATQHLPCLVKPSPLSYPTTLSPSTQYTVFHNRKNYNGSVKTPMINLGGTKVSATGSRTIVTTPSTLVHNELQFIGGENTVEQVMVLHGDWTKQGKTVDYFEGLQSSVIGDKTLENLVGEPDAIWATPNNSDHVHVDNTIAKYAPSVPKLPEVQVSGQLESNGMTLKNLANVETKDRVLTKENSSAIVVESSSQFKPNTKYIALANVKTEGADSIYSAIQLYDDKWNFLENCFGHLSSQTPYIIFTIGSVAPTNIHLSNVHSDDNVILTISNVTIFEYQDGLEHQDIPYFEGMKSVENPVLTTTGKNLFSGRDTSNKKHDWASFPITLEAGTYVTSNNSKERNTTIVRYEDNYEITIASIFTLDVRTTVVLCGSTEDRDYFQLEKGSIPTSYEPYKSTVLLAPQGTVLHGVGDYVDRLGYDDGIIRRNCVEFTISGEEGYNIYNIIENTNTIMCNISWKTLGLENKIPTNDGVNMVVCDKLPSKTGSEDIPHIRQTSGEPYIGALVIWFDKTKFSTYTSQGINDYIKSIGGLTIVAPLANTEYESVQLIGGGNWDKWVIDGGFASVAGEGDSVNGFSVWKSIPNAVGTQDNNKPKQCYYIESELDWLLHSEIVGQTKTNFVAINGNAIVINVRGCHSVDEVNAWLSEHPITVWYQSTSNTITNTDPLLFNHGAVYTETDCLPTTLNNFSLKTTNRRPIKDMSTLKYTILTDKEFRFNNVTYAPSSTGMTIVDVTTIVDTYMYSDDDMVTVVQDDGNYYADGVLTQFKGEMTFTKEFIRTGNGTYNTGMTLLEPLELNGLPNGVRDGYNPTTGEIIRNIGVIDVIPENFQGFENNGVTSKAYLYDERLKDRDTTKIAALGVLSNNFSPIDNTSVYTYGVVGATNNFPVWFSLENTITTLEDFRLWFREHPQILLYQLATPQIIQANPTSTYISTRPKNGNIVAEDTQIHAEYLNYDNEQSIISPRMLGEGDKIRWEQGSQCYVYENAKEYIPLTDNDELFGANIQAQEYAQYVESVDGADIELGIPLKEKAVYQQSYVTYEDNIVYPTTRENLDETNGVEVDYICGATWQNPNDLSDIRHLGELREDGQYDVTIRRSGDDEIRLMEGTTHISLDYDKLPPSEFELTFFNNGGVEVGKYGDTTHVLEDCVENGKLASGTVYGQTLVNLFDHTVVNPTYYSYENGIFSKIRDDGTAWDNMPNIIRNVKPNTTYTFIIKPITSNYSYIVINKGDRATDTIFKYTTDNNASLKIKHFSSDGSYPCSIQLMILEGDYTNVDLPYFEGMKSTVVNGFSSCGKNLWTSENYGSYYSAGHTYVLKGYKPTYPVTLSSKAQRTISKGIHVKPNTYYTISITNCDLDISKYYLIATWYRKEEDAISDVVVTPNYVINTNGNQGATKTFKTPSDCYYMVCGFAINYTYEQQGGEIVLYEEPMIQVEEGQTVTEFEEPKTINYTLPTPITLRSVGDVCDTFDVVSGTYTQKIHSIMLDDTWNWTSYTDDFDTMPNHVFIELTSDNNMSHPLNNSFALTSPTAPTYLADIWNKPQYANDHTIVIGMSQVSQTKCQLLIPKSFLNGTPSFNSTKQYLKENPISVLYEFATPITTQHTLIPSTTQTTQEPTFILPQPLRSVPNGICDRLYWDENKGHYCIEKRIGTTIVNGTNGGSVYTPSQSKYTCSGTNMLPIPTSSLSYGMVYAYGWKTITDNEMNVANKTYDAPVISCFSATICMWIPTITATDASNTNERYKQYFRENSLEVYHALATPEIIDLPHLDKKVELLAQPNVYPIGYKAVHDKTNPEIGLTIPYKVLNMPTQPINLDFKMDIADYVLTWDDVKEARLYNIILNDEVIATTKQPYWNSGEEMYGYILVEAQNEIGDSVSKELYIKTVPNAPAQLTVAHNPVTDHYDFEISFIDKSTIADYYTVQYRVDGGEWIINNIPNDQLSIGEKQLWSFSVYEISESIEVWATATNDVGTNDILPSAIYYMSPTPQWTYRINSKDVFLRWIDESPYDTKYKLRYSYLSNGQYQYAYFEGDKQEIGKLYEAVVPLAEDDEVTIALCIVSEKENLYCKPVKASKEKDPNIVPPLNFNYRWLARGLIEFYWQDQYNVDIEYEYILETMKGSESIWTQINEVITSTDVEGTGTIYRVEYQLEDLEQIRMKVRMRWAMNETQWTETLTTVFIPVEGNPPTYIRRTQTAEGLLVEWEAQAYIDSYHIYVIDNETKEVLQHLETQDNSIIIDLNYDNSIEVAIYEVSRFSGGIESDPTDAMVFTPTMSKITMLQNIYQPCVEEHSIEVSTVQRGSKQPYVIHDISYTPNVESEGELQVNVSTPFLISYHPTEIDVHQVGSKTIADMDLRIKTLDTRTEETVEVMTFERITDTYDMNFQVYTPSVMSYPITLDVSKVRIVCLGDSLTSGHPYYWD